MKTLMTILVIVLASMNITAGVKTEKRMVRVILRPVTGSEYRSEATVTLLSGNTEMYTLIKPNNRKGFELMLEEGHYYTLQVKLDGHIDRKIVFNTELPSGTQANSILNFEIDVVMPPENAELDDDYTDFPVAIADYDPSKKQIGFRKKYTSNLKFLLTEDKPVVTYSSSHEESE